MSKSILSDDLLELHRTANLHSMVIAPSPELNVARLASENVFPEDLYAFDFSVSKYFSAP